MITRHATQICTWSGHMSSDYPDKTRESEKLLINILEI